MFEVSNTLGAGFLEKVYERSLVIELDARGLRAKAQPALAIFYKGMLVGEYSPDTIGQHQDHAGAQDVARRQTP